MTEFGVQVLYLPASSVYHIASLQLHRAIFVCLVGTLCLCVLINCYINVL